MTKRVVNIPDWIDYNERRVCCDCGHEFLTKRDGFDSNGAVIFFRDAATGLRVLVCECGGPLHQRSTMLVQSPRLIETEVGKHNMRDAAHLAACEDCQIAREVEEQDWTLMTRDMRPPYL